MVMMPVVRKKHIAALGEIRAAEVELEFAVGAG